LVLSTGDTWSHKYAASAGATSGSLCIVTWRDARTPALLRGWEGSLLYILRSYEVKPKFGKNSQQWIFDYLIKTTGKTAHWETEAGLDRLPPEVRSWDMIPRVLEKKGAREEELGRKAEAAGHFVTAFEAYNRAYMTYFEAQHVICEDNNTRKIQLYQRMLDCHDKVRQYNDYPIEKVEIPWEGKTIPALLHLLPDRRKAPCCLYVPGLDRTKEAFPYVSGAATKNPFGQRGFHVLVIDGPGQGEARMRGIKAYPDNHREAGKAAIDYLMTRPEIDGDKIVLFGVSMGTYWGAHIAAFDSRVKAAATAVGCYIMNRLSIFEEASPRFRLTYKYMTGIEDEDEFDEMVAKMTLKGVGSKIKCPFLIWAGEFDPLNPLEEAEAFFDEIAGPKEIWVNEYDFHNAPARALCGIPITHIAADWLKDKLEGKYPRNLARKVLIAPGSIGPYVEK